MEAILAGIDLARTRITIVANANAPVILAMLDVVAERRDVDKAKITDFLRLHCTGRSTSGPSRPVEKPHRACDLFEPQGRRAVAKGSPEAVGQTLDDRGRGDEGLAGSAPGRSRSGQARVWKWVRGNVDFRVRSRPL
jgi:hypothetical protein